MIHFLCALQCEARPLIQRFGLRQDIHARHFRFYVDGRGTTSLTVSGPGKLAAAAAAMFAAGRVQAGPADAWLNVGVAGHGYLALGRAAMANRVEDAGSGQAWFPVTPFERPVPAAAVLTLDRPRDDYGDAFFDLEAAGFYATLCRVGTLELIHCLKVVSDNPDRPLRPLPEREVSDLIEGRLAHVETLVSRLRELAGVAAEQEAASPHLDGIVARWRFSETQRRRLERLLRRWDALLPDQDPLAGSAGASRNAAALLDQIQECVDAARLNLVQR